MKTLIARLLRFALLSGSLLWFLTAPLSLNTLEAQTGKLGNEFDYYSDDTFTVQVGFVVYCSSGQTFRSGDQTPYVIIQPAGC